MARSDFEAWAKANHLDVHKATDDGYFDAQTSNVWAGWEACEASRPSVDMANLKLLQEAVDYGQFSEHFNQPLVPPLRRAVKQLIEEAAQGVLVPPELWKEIHSVLSARQFITLVGEGAGEWDQDNDEEVQSVLEKMDKLKEPS